MKPRFVNCVTDLKLHGGGAKAGLTLFLSSRYTSWVCLYLRFRSGAVRCGCRERRRGKQQA